MNYEEKLQELQETTPVERLCAAMLFWLRQSPDAAQWIEYGFGLAQETTPEERLQTAKEFSEKMNPGCAEWIEYGFQLAQENGWEHIAPSWLRDYKQAG